MASVIKRKESKYWFACFTSHDGRQLKRSTKSTDKREATRIANEIEALERKARTSSVTSTQLQKVFSDVSERLTGDRMDIPSIEEYLKDWLEYAGTRNSPSTLKRYDKVVRAFIQTLGSKSSSPVSSISPSHIEHFVTERMQSGLAPMTVKVDLKTLGTAFRRAEVHELIIKNPVPAVTPPKAESSERGIFTPEEVEKIINAAPSVDWQTLILLGYFVGARLSDCVHMRWDNVDPDNQVISFEQQKTKRKVIVPIHPILLQHLVYLSDHFTKGYLCPTLAAKGPGGKHGLSEGFKRIMKRAGVDVQLSEGKGVRRFCKRTFHSLRHSFTSSLANAGVPEEIRMKLTGHTTRDIHTRYTHHELESLKNAISSLSLKKKNSESI